jgi:uncharacterized coiled-coil DUF342 family protein
VAPHPILPATPQIWSLSDDMTGRRQFDSIADLRREWHRIQDELEKTISHANKLLEQYDNLQDDLVHLERAIDETKEEFGITEKTITAPESDEIDKLLEDL